MNTIDMKGITIMVSLRFGHATGAAGTAGVVAFGILNPTIAAGKV